MDNITPEPDYSIDDELTVLSEIELDSHVGDDVHYVVGKLKKDGLTPLIAALVPTSRGWSCRSIYSNELRHEYVSNETMDDVTDWLSHDLCKDWYLSTDREDILASLSTLLEESGVSRHPHLVCGNPCSQPHVSAEAVLRHLELGR